MLALRRGLGARCRAGPCQANPGLPFACLSKVRERDLASLMQSQIRRFPSAEAALGGGESTDLRLHQRGEIAFAHF